MTSSTELTKILPSPILPVRAALVIASMQASTLDLGGCHTRDPDRGERFTHIVQLEWFDYCVDFFHLAADPVLV